ncbi:uncharacterized protein FPRO_13673 [Fusarium proliferatum ET1]|uniref:2EXR domain-containing protein n=1 Tax=Fusarium proliferatum (strain ET1) TaxID=1227346 RepID=A0A1L7VUU1_FUSPR|nr:uncharacterized protein FPRO_13673 [Fusarium proliferatum ET1]CZR43866.1 uncharacterized protein FPRO_13673 [Fusarium proliferatum ET1]
MSSFPLFSRLPPELRLEVWKLAASTPRVIHLDVSDGEFGNIFTTMPPHPLLQTCYDSRRAFLEKNRDVVPSGQGEPQKGAHKPNLATNFERDLFLIRGNDDWPMQLFPRRHFIYQLRKIAVDLGSASHMSSLLWRFFQWQELWIFLGQVPDHFCPSPVSKFRRHCPLHHCEVFPKVYHPSGQQRQSGLPCPACEWADSLYDHSVPYPRYWGNVRVTVDSSLPRYPSVGDILKAENPVLRCIRVCEDVPDKEGTTSYSVMGCHDTLSAAAAACLVGNRHSCCH